MALKREYSERFRDGGATTPSRGRGIFQQENIRDAPRPLRGEKANTWSFARP